MYYSNMVKIPCDLKTMRILLKIHRTFITYADVGMFLFSQIDYTVKHLISAVSKFRGIMKKAYWRILILAFIKHHVLR